MEKIDPLMWFNWFVNQLQHCFKIELFPWSNAVFASYFCINSIINKNPITWYDPTKRKRPWKTQNISEDACLMLIKYGTLYYTSLATIIDSSKKLFHNGKSKYQYCYIYFTLSKISSYIRTILRKMNYSGQVCTKHDVIFNSG